MINYLNEAIENGIIDLDSVIFAMTKKEIKEKHPYKIYQGKDGRWRTYIPAENDYGRKMIVKPTEKELCDILKKLYENDEETLRTLYPKWLEYKRLHTTAPTYIVRIEADWTKFYLGSDIIGIPIRKLDKIKLDEFLHRLIKDNNMTKNCYYNATVIIRQALDYAVDLGIISTNPMTLVKIDGRRMFRKVQKKPDETQVFSLTEYHDLIEIAKEDFETTKSKHPLAPLAFIFQMQTGIRLGEVCTVKYSDIEKTNYIHIQRMLRDNNGEVVEHTKTNCGDRLVPLTDLAKEVIEMSKKKSGGVYIFSEGPECIPKHAITNLYRKYCNMAGINFRSSHKSRKTYISALIDANVNINTIRKIVGHADERTTLGNYCFDRKSEREKLDVINNAL